MTREVLITAVLCCIDQGGRRIDRISSRIDQGDRRNRLIGVGCFHIKETDGPLLGSGAPCSWSGGSATSGVWMGGGGRDRREWRVWFGGLPLDYGGGKRILGQVSSKIEGLVHYSFDTF